MVVCKVVSTALLRVGQLLQQLDNQRVTEAKMTVDVCTCTEGRDQVVGAGPKHTTHVHLSLTSVGDEGQV